MKACFQVYIPEDIALDERFKRPIVGITILHPGWREYSSRTARRPENFRSIHIGASI